MTFHYDHYNSSIYKLLSVLMCWHNMSLIMLLELTVMELSENMFSSRKYSKHSTKANVEQRCIETKGMPCLYRQRRNWDAAAIGTWQ